MRSDYSDYPSQIRAVCGQITALNVDDVVGMGNPVSSSFDKIRERVRGTVALAVALASCDFDNVPDEELKPVVEKLVGTQQQLDRMAAFCRGRNENVSLRDSLSNSFFEAHRQFFAAAAPLIAFSRSRGTDLHEIERQIREARDRIKELKDDSESIHRGLQDYAVKSVVSRQAEFFAEQASIHAAGAKKWLSAVLALALLVLVAAAVSMFHPPIVVKDEPLLFVAQWVPRLAIASVLFWGISLSSRNYRAHRHNEVANLHRALSLRTFNVFVSASDDPAVKSAVLAQVASTVFAAQPSGYSPDQADPMPHATAVELLQRMGKQ